MGARKGQERFYVGGGLGWQKPFFLGDRRPCRRKPFFLGDMMLQGGALTIKIDFAAWGLDSTTFLFFFWQLPSESGALTMKIDFAGWGLDSTIPFFFFGSCHVTLSHWALMAQWPDGLWKKTPRLFFFWSLGQCPSQWVQTKKKQKKKSCKKKVLLYKY